MLILILGGTGWLGHELARQAVAEGHGVTCLARGVSGEVPAGSALVVADRMDPRAYDQVRSQDWDAVIDITWQPRFAHGALENQTIGVPQLEERLTDRHHLPRFDGARKDDSVHRGPHVVVFDRRLQRRHGRR